MKKIIILALAMSIVGCMGVAKKAPGKYQITEHGDEFSSREKLQKKMDTKARRLCGHSDYQYEGDGIFNSKSTYVSTRSADVLFFMLVREVNCNPDL